MSKAPDKKAPHTPADDPVSQFEADMKALEALVQQLEAADLPLDQSIALFEQGTQLSQRCRTALDTATIELIHAYSLVHDDLPAMDNDDLRRGQPTVHKAFGEATAILVGDTLNTLAFGVLATADTLDATARVQLVATLAAAAGARGMVGGQVLDLAAQHGDAALPLDALTTLHQRKTGALIQACFDMAGIAAAATPAQRDALSTCGAALGLAYQIQDDVLDVDAATAQLGKTAGKDARDGKQTFVSLLGLDAARDRAAAAFGQARTAAYGLPDPAALLALIDTVAQRRH